MSKPKSYPLLRKAPIVEAVIDFRARASVPWEEALIHPLLTKQLADYPNLQSLQDVTVNVQFGPETAQPAKHATWHGIIARNSDNTQVVQFHRDGFTFSRLAPYKRWEEFAAEALRLWSIHCDIAQPQEIQRLGVRYINRILLPIVDDRLRLADYLKGLPQPKGKSPWQTGGFFYRDVFKTDDRTLNATVIRTNQPPESQTLPLVLDIDVASTAPMHVGKTLVDRHLTAARTLKNKVFFHYLTKHCLELFQ